MLITFTRPLSNDIRMLESTWHHVSEEEGVRLQLQEEFDYVPTAYLDSYGHTIVFRFVEHRRIVTGTFHPGRRILPHSAITHELVYDCIVNSDVKIDEDALWNQVNNVFRNYEVRGTRTRGNHTIKSEAA